MIADVNVLVAAYLQEHASHVKASKWLSEHLGLQGEIYLLPNTVAGFVRIATHSKIFKMPASAQDAIGFIDALAALAQTHWMDAPQSLVWRHFSALCTTHQLKQNAIPDAWIAAQALALGCKVATLDKDFSRLLPKASLVFL